MSGSVMHALEIAKRQELQDELERVTAERDRLREALEKIAAFDNPPRYRIDVNTAYSVAVGAVNIARAAIAKARGEG